MRLLILVSAALLLFTGCDLGSHKNRQDVPQVTNAPPVVIKADPYTGPTKEDLAQIKTEIQSSNNAVQTSQTGLNANVNKLGERLTGVEGKVVGLETTFATELTATVTGIKEVNSNLKSEIVTEMKAEFTSQIGDIKTEVRGLIQAFTQIQLEARASVDANTALKNEVSKLQTEVKAGRDAYTNVYQFTKEQLDAQRSENRTQIAAITILCAFFTIVLIVILDASRRRQVYRAKAAADAANLPEGVTG